LTVGGCTPVYRTLLAVVIYEGIPQITMEPNE